MPRRLIPFLSICVFALTTVCSVGAVDAQAQVPGDFDRSFAAPAGMLISTFGGPLVNGAKQSVAVQADGKYVVASTCSGAGSTTHFCAFRLNADGSYDTSFVGPDAAAPGNGKVVVPMGSNSVATALMIQRDGKILLAGYCDFAGHREFCIARLNGDGSFDERYEGPDPDEPGRGRFVIRNQAGSIPDRTLVAAMLMPDERVLLVGYCYQGLGASFISRMCLARLTPDGLFDETFDGPNVNAPGNGQFSYRLGSDENLPTSVALRADGVIVIGGYCQGATATVSYACMAQLLDDGSFDRNFFGPRGRFGETEFSMGGSSSRVNSVIVQEDGRVVAIGECLSGGATHVCVARVRSDGLRDTSFASATGTLVIPIANTSVTVAQATQQRDGKILIAGTCATGGQSRICLMRLHPDATLDSNFDGWTGIGDGVSMLPANAFGDMGRAVALVRDGRIVLTGACSDGVAQSLCVARLNGGPFAAARCSFDIDGDGSVSALTDALILARVARGMTGAAVAEAIQFAPAATRRTWPAIQQYLSSQCDIALPPN